MPKPSDVDVLHAELTARHGKLEGASLSALEKLELHTRLATLSNRLWLQRSP